MGQKQTNLTIVFADVAGSTRLYETIGDVAAREAIAKCLDTISEQVTRFGGIVIKTIGDEIMCTFPDAETGVNACRAMQEAIEDENQAAGNSVTLAIRIGLHYGPAILEGGDVFGDAVNVAARMAAQAKAQQIITTKDTQSLLSPELRSDTRFVDRADIKGKQETIDIFEVMWQEDEADVTRMATGVIVTTVPSATLVLTSMGNETTINSTRPGVVLGRGQACDVTINDTMASRMHVRIEHRKGKFFLIDQSTNGTYVRLGTADPVFVRREEISLGPSGEFSLGRAIGEKPEATVYFEQKS